MECGYAILSLEKRQIGRSKKIKKTQQLRMIKLAGRGNAVYELSSDGVNLGKALVIYGLDVPKSEW